jgi:hypothetical protein
MMPLIAATIGDRTAPVETGYTPELAISAAVGSYSKNRGRRGKSGCLVLANFVRDQRFFSGSRPTDPEQGIAPQHTAIVLGRLIGAYLVNDLRIGRERRV